MIYKVIEASYLKEILIGNCMAYIQAILNLNNSAHNISRNLIDISQSNLFIQQLFNYFDMETNDPVMKQQSICSSLIDLKEIKKIEFRDVSFKYPGALNYTLKNVSFPFNAGESIAIVGRNGSGKTTIVKLLTQLYDNYEGEIFFNDIPLEICDKDKIRKLLGVVFQDFMKYELTVRTNIGFGDLSNLKNDSKFYHSAELFGVQDIINKMPKKLDTQLGRWFKDGFQLSGGEWQKLAITRAYFRNASIYILDEPSAALDPLTELETFKMFRNLIHGKIGIFITHRYSSVQYASRIIVIDNGSVVEEGSHIKLIKDGGVYADLYKTQLVEKMKKPIN